MPLINYFRTALRAQLRRVKGTSNYLSGPLHRLASRLTRLGRPSRVWSPSRLVLKPIRHRRSRELIDQRFPGRSAGFTLIEVMVAMVIAVLALTGVLASISQMVDAGIAMRERTYASWIAQNKISELRLANVIPEVSQSNGEIEYAGLDWAWTATISETGVENLFRVDVDVAFAGSNDNIRSVTGFIGEPVIPGESNRAWLQSGQVPGERE